MKLFFLACMIPVLAITAHISVAQTEPHTPEKGSAERRAILDVVRKHRKAPADVYTPTAFYVLKDWAYIAAPDPSDPGVDTEAFECIVHKIGGRWKVVDEISHVEGSNYGRELKRIRKRFPSMPVAIVPKLRILSFFGFRPLRQSLSRRLGLMTRLTTKLRVAEPKLYLVEILLNKKLRSFKLKSHT